MHLRHLAALTGCLVLAGCVSVPLGTHAPASDTVMTVRDSGISPLAVGDFKLAAGLKPSLDQSVTMRGNPIKPPTGNSFSQYLKDSLIADLKAGGKYDAASPLSVHGELTENVLNAAGISEASAAIAAHFSVYRGDQVVYDKTLRQESSWKSSFVGVVAFPEALNQYTEQYSRLLAKLYADQDFLRACSSSR